MSNKNRKTKQPGWRNFIFGLSIFIAIILVMSAFYMPAEEVKNITLSELATNIKDGEVESIVISGDTITADLKNEEKIKTKKEAESSFTETLTNYGVNPEILSSINIEVKDESGFKFWASILFPTVLPLLIIGFFLWMMFKRSSAGASQALNFGKSNIKLFTRFNNKTTFKDVAGLKEAKQELEEVVDFLKNPNKYLEIGAKIPRGVLLLGPPGTGKTLLSRAVAGEAGVPFFHLSASEFVEMFVGVGASRTRDAFATAKKAAPSILFIDEIDAVGRERGAGVGGGHDEREQTLNQILVEMDGFDRDSKVIVLAATNRPDVLDRALLRPGRFDRRVILDLPSIDDREEIIKIHARDKKFVKDVDFRQIAIRTPGFSGADLANLVNEAAISAARENKKQVEQIHLYDSVEKVLLGPERRSVALSKKEKEITAYHEAGHALVSALLKDSDPVHKISIVARGMAGGYTLKLPIEEKRLKTRKQFLADIAVAFGGYAAEKIVFKDITTGASNDISVASDMTRKIVTKYGMSDKFGPIAFGKTQELIFLGKEMAHERNYSEEIAAEIDNEVEKIIKNGYKTAEDLLKKNKKFLDKLADILIEKETIEKDEFDKIMKKFKIKPVDIK